jgi:hypothetical protein
VFESHRICVGVVPNVASGGCVYIHGPVGDSVWLHLGLGLYAVVVALFVSCTTCISCVSVVASGWLCVHTYGPSGDLVSGGMGFLVVACGFDAGRRFLP